MEKNLKEIKEEANQRASAFIELIKIAETLNKKYPCTKLERTTQIFSPCFNIEKGEAELIAGDYYAGPNGSIVLYTVEAAEELQDNYSDLIKVYFGIK
jgi:hypothetical protein